ncbi:hypothetical protein F7P83_07355 [Brevibacterium luteolum]|nr:hypothetical protein [Brevibacterium luteolum]
MSNAQWDEAIAHLTGMRRIPQDIAYVLARESHDHPEFRQILLTLDSVQDCVINAVDPERTGRWNSMSIIRHFDSPFADWIDKPAYALRSLIATRRQKRACGVRESIVYDMQKAGEPAPADTVGEVWERILREEDYLNVERSQFHEWHFDDIIRRFPDKVRRGADTPAQAGLSKEAMRIIAGWGDAGQRAELALNPELQPDVLLGLIDDPDEAVARACALNPQCVGDLANRLEARIPELGESLDRHPRADVDRQLRVPADRIGEGSLRWFLRAVIAGPEEVEAVLTERLSAAGEGKTLGALWFDIGWQAAESAVPLV